MLYDSLQSIDRRRPAPPSAAEPFLQGAHNIIEEVREALDSDVAAIASGITGAAATALLGESQLELQPAAAHSDARSSSLDAFRIPAGDRRRVAAWERAWAEQRHAAGAAGLISLALSCGGANGAFGAGAMIGWSQSGRRPAFDVVTGVSTGALIAPFVFAGPAWDEQLRAAFMDRRLPALAERGLLAKIRSGVGALFQSSLAGAAPLIRLVRDHADERLLWAIAAAHDLGRRLLVATTKVDTLECVIWDLGAIAKASTRPDDHGRALQLFRSVLIASASVPGIFPAAPIAWDPEAGDVELHMDGCVNAPFFLAPGSMLMGDRAGKPRELHLVINGSLGPGYQKARRGVIPILFRALDTMGRANMRARVAALEILADRHGIAFSCTAIPDDQPADPFNFKTENLKSLLAFGHAELLCAVAQRAAEPWPTLARRAGLQGPTRRLKRAGGVLAEMTPGSGAHAVATSAVASPRPLAA